MTRKYWYRTIIANHQDEANGPWQLPKRDMDVWWASIKRMPDRYFIIIDEPTLRLAMFRYDGRRSLWLHVYK